MEDYSTHSVPEPFQDEDKWAHLTKRQILILLPTVLLIFFVVVASIKLHLLVIGIVLAVLIAIAGLMIAFFEIPDDKYLFGSGTRLEVLSFRVLWKKLPFNRVIYTKNLDNGYKDWGKKKKS